MAEFSFGGVTIREVAKAAGVSVATVSRVLNGRRVVRAETAERVHAAATRLGYAVNPAQAASASRRFALDRRLRGTPLAFMVQPGPSRDRVALNQHHEAFCRRAKSLGYRVETFLLREGTDPGALGRRLFQEGFAGVALDFIRGDRSFFSRFDWSPYAVVCLDPMLREPRFDCVVPHIAENSDTIWRQAIDHGYRRVAWVLSHHPEPHPDDRTREAMATLQLGAAVSQRLFVAGPIRFEVPRGFRSWLRNCRPDAVLGFPATVTRWLTEVGCDVPCATCAAGPTGPGIYEDREHIAEVACERLDAAFRLGIRGIPGKPLTISVKGSWRGSWQQGD